MGKNEAKTNLGELLKECSDATIRAGIEGIEPGKKVAYAKKLLKEAYAAKRESDSLFAKGNRTIRTKMAEQEAIRSGQVPDHIQKAVYLRWYFEDLLENSKSLLEEAKA